MRVATSRTRHAIAALAIGALNTPPMEARADNPIVQTLYTADPAPFVHDGRIYVFTGHDEDQLVNNFFTMNDWRVYSSLDMVNWTDHGRPLGYKTFSWSNGDAWAGQVIGRNGKFYYYVPTNRNGIKVLGVAVSDTPIGPYEDALGKPLLSSSCGDIDPTAFVDDDGQAYLYWGNPRLCYVKLNADMVSYTGGVVQVPMTTASFGPRSKTDRPTTYEEGPWFYKRQGRYYLVFAGGPISEHIGYATSSGPTGPWLYAGVVMPSEGASFTNHAGVADYKGKSYFFYHNGALPGGGGFHRSVCVEEFAYGPDGKIPALKMTKEGPAAVAALNPFQRIEAETIAFSSGLKTEVCADEDGGMNVTSIANGDYIKLKNVDFRAGATAFEARVSSAASNARIELHLDSMTGPLLGTCDLSNLQSWTTKSCAVSGGGGKHDLFLKFSGGAGDLFKFNWWRFRGPDEPDEDGSAADGGFVGTDGDAGAVKAADAAVTIVAEAGAAAREAGAGRVGGADNAATTETGRASGSSSAGDASASSDVSSASELEGEGCGCRARRRPSGSTRGASFALLGLSLLLRRRSREAARLRTAR